jgi:hypothetical protein
MQMSSLIELFRAENPNKADFILRFPTRFKRGFVLVSSAGCHLTQLTDWKLLGSITEE